MDVKTIEKNIEMLFIVFLLLLGTYYVVLAYSTQMLGEDEAVYYGASNEFAQGTYRAFLPADKPFVSPVLMSLTATPFFLIFGSSLGALKAVSALFGILSLFIVFLIGKKINVYYGIFAAILLLSIQMFTQFMMLAYVETPITFFSALLIYCYLTLDNTKKAVLTGAILSLAFYTKASALVLVAVPFVYGVFLWLYEKNKQYVKFAVVSILTFVALVAPFAIRNILLYHYPFVEGLNVLFGASPLQWPTWLSDVFKTVSPVRPGMEMYISSFGWLAIVLGIFGFGWLATNWKHEKKERDLLIMQLLTIFFFIAVFNIVYFFGTFPLESRYLSIIFPSIVLLGGFFIWKINQWNKWLILLIVPILLFSTYVSATTVFSTHGSQRYPADYIDALHWIKANTTSDALLFTTYGGSTKYFGERESIWTWEVKEFPELMNSNNGTYIADTLKHYNISYILIWRATVAQNYIIPESNLWGVFTYNFVDVVSKDTEDFETVYSNQDNWILKLK